jgi:hypothetical protein
LGSSNGKVQGQELTSALTLSSLGRAPEMVMVWRVFNSGIEGRLLVTQKNPGLEDSQ